MPEHLCRSALAKTVTQSISNKFDVVAAEQVNGAPAAASKLRDAIARDIVTLCIDSRFPPPHSHAPSGRGYGQRPHRFDLLCDLESLENLDRALRL
jgi:hypothetical protein